MSNYFSTSPLQYQFLALTIAISNWKKIILLFYLPSPYRDTNQIPKVSLTSWDGSWVVIFPCSSLFDIDRPSSIKPFLILRNPHHKRVSELESISKEKSRRKKCSSDLIARSRRADVMFYEQIRFNRRERTRQV